MASHLRRLSKGNRGKAPGVKKRVYAGYTFNGNIAKWTWKMNADIRESETWGKIGGVVLARWGGVV